MRSSLFAPVLQALRATARRPMEHLGFVAVASVGIGLATTIFSIADPFLSRPLPMRSDSDLVSIRLSTEGLRRGAAVPRLSDWQGRSDLFAGVSAHSLAGRQRFRFGDTWSDLVIADVTHNYMQVLDVLEPGLPIEVSDATLMLTPAGQKAIERAVSNIPATAQLATGETVHLARLPEHFVFPDPQWGHRVHALRKSAVIDEVVTSSAWLPDGRPSGRGVGPGVLARLNPAISTRVAQAGLMVPLQTGETPRITVEALPTTMRRPLRGLATGALIAGVIVLSVCFANLLNLHIARTTFRQGEFLTRRALGSSWLAIVALEVAELALLMAVGTLLALFVAVVTVAWLGQLIPEDWVRLGRPVVGFRSTMFAALAGSLTLGGLAMASSSLEGRRRSYQTRLVPLRDGRSRHLRAAATAMQAGIAVILVVGATALSRSYARLMNEPIGYSPHAISATVSYRAGTPGVVAMEAVQKTLDDLNTSRLVAAVSATTGSVVADGLFVRSFDAEGATIVANVASVTEGFFESAGISLTAGRILSAIDRRGAGVVVNQAFAQHAWPGRDPIGRQVRSGSRVSQVVGIVGNVKSQTLDAPSEPIVYSVLEDTNGLPVTFVARPNLARVVEPAEIATAIRKSNQEATVSSAEYLSDRLRDTVRDKAFATVVLGLFGTASFSVTLVGLLAVVTFVGLRRRREIAIRLAIGATPSHIRWIVAKETLLSATAGGVFGLAAGYWLLSLLGGFVYGPAGAAVDWTSVGIGGIAVLVTMWVAALAQGQRVVGLSAAECLRD